MGEKEDESLEWKSEDAKETFDKDKEKCDRLNDELTALMEEGRLAAACVRRLLDGK